MNIYHYKPNKKENLLFWGFNLILLIIPSVICAIFLIYKKNNFTLNTIIVLLCVSIFFLIIKFYYNIFFKRASLDEKGIISIPLKNKASINTFYFPDFTLNTYKFSIANIKRAYILSDFVDIENAKKISKIDIPLSRHGWEIAKDKTICFEFVTPIIKDPNKRRNYHKNEVINKVYLPITEPEKMLEDIEKLKQATHVRPDGD